MGESAPTATMGSTPTAGPERALARRVRARIEAAAPSFGAGDTKVARLLLEQPDAVIYQSVSEAADAAGTSTATVVRFAQKLGLRGFQELKLALANDLPAAGRPSATDHRSVLDRVTAAAAQSARDAAALVSANAFESAVAILNNARHVLWVGVGNSATIAQEGAYLARVIGIESEAPTDVHVKHLASRQLHPDDACVAISQTGATRETLTVVEGAKAAGAHTIAITSFLNSPLTELADVVLTAGSREVNFGLEGMERRIGLLVVVHALLVAVAEQDEKRSSNAQNLFADVMAEHLL
jgi:RpiR family carbohydrate utilization transcriptional regulator